MLKKPINYLGFILFALLILTGCSKYDETLKILPNEIIQANECKNINKEFERDCYELISYKNSIALIRLGIIDEQKGKYKYALEKYNLAKTKNNFYANALLADFYYKGKVVKQNQSLAIELLEKTKDIDPMAAYKLAIIEINKKNSDQDDIVELLEFAANNDFKQAQKILIRAYRVGNFGLTTNKQEANKWERIYKNRNKNIMKYIYGI